MKADIDAKPGVVATQRELLESRYDLEAAVTRLRLVAHAHRPGMAVAQRGHWPLRSVMLLVA